MDEEIARLVREERIVEAGELASSRGESLLASELFERACDWRRAASEAMRAGDPARAMPLAVEGKDDALAGAAMAAIASDANVMGRVAMQLERRGAHLWCARLLEAAGRKAEAARAWEKGGDAARAAALLELANDVVGAARVLESAIRRDGTRWPLHVALGDMLLRYNKVEAAVRALQKVPAEAPERRHALTLLLRALDHLGLAQAFGEASHELAALGGPVVIAEQRTLAAEVRTRLFGRYEVLKEVASSPTSRVVECIDGVKNEHVAVKIFAGYETRGGGRDALARFEREVKVLGALDHPNVVPLRDYIEDGPAIVLSWMSGGTLEKMLADRKVAPARAVEIACAVLSALGEAHRLGVLHRDVKPANILFDDAGVTRLGDFGVAHLGDLSATATAGVFGTLAYMSPEQREGRPATVQSDLYGVGVVLCEMLTGERPNTDEVPRTRPSGAHRDLDTRHDDAVLKLLATNPERRPPDAFTARRALTALSWPSVLEAVGFARPTPTHEDPKSERPPRTRVEVTEDGRTIDTWIGRSFDRVALTDVTLARASAFARAAHPALQAILRVDREECEIWLEPPRGRALDGALTPAQLSFAHAALDALHGMGAIHGSIDRAHLAVDPSGALTIRFAPECDPTATVDRDRLALSRL